MRKFINYLFCFFLFITYRWHRVGMEKNVGRKRYRVERLLARSREIHERPQLRGRSHHSSEQVRIIYLYSNLTGRNVWSGIFSDVPTTYVKGILNAGLWLLFFLFFFTILLHRSPLSGKDNKVAKRSSLENNKIRKKHL